MMKNNKIKKILIANRGEIAVRIIRTCKEMNINSVAVFSDIDRSSLHVRFASQAYHIGDSDANKSYLCFKKIIKAAKDSKSDAIHPGYGFLSENIDFAKEVEKSGLIFIGPPLKSMEIMSSKIKARKFMKQAGVPIIPGFNEVINFPQKAMFKAKEIGFPIMLKAAAGGGGKGMRKVEQIQDFSSLFISAKSEALNAFGNSSIYIEKFLNKPRHIEIQIFADQYGNIKYFPERECSIQRRYQKLIEESPSTFVDNNMRIKMGETACKAAKAVGYVGAGTVEFLVDENKKFYFMEMNTRIQVEHAISEMITGIDLIKWQIKVAQGETLNLEQSKLKANGWAIEARICAEDSEENFMPTPGIVNYIQQSGGPFIRIDTAIYNGTIIPIEYDSMIAKIIAWGEDRTTAINRLIRALSETDIKGCTTNIEFLKKILNFEKFQIGLYDTDIIKQFKKQSNKNCSYENKKISLISAAILKFKTEQDIQKKTLITQNQKSIKISNWRIENINNKAF